MKKTTLALTALLGLGGCSTNESLTKIDGRTVESSVSRFDTAETDCTMKVHDFPAKGYALTMRDADGDKIPDVYTIELYGNARAEAVSLYQVNKKEIEKQKGE